MAYNSPLIVSTQSLLESYYPGVIALTPTPFPSLTWCFDLGLALIIAAIYSVLPPSFFFAVAILAGIAWLLALCWDHIKAPYVGPKIA